MLLRFLITVTALSIASVSGHASEASTEELRSTILPFVDRHDPEMLNAAMANGLWDESKKAYATAFPLKNRTGIYAFIFQQPGKASGIDLSPIERNLFRKLGSADRSAYERYETVPVEWKSMENERRMLIIRLRAWKDGQRYAVTGSVVIEANGDVIWQ